MPPAQYHSFSEKDIQNLALNHFGLRASSKKLPGHDDLNFYLKTEDQKEYILKITASGEEEATLDFQNQIMLYLAKAKLPFLLPQVIPNKNGQTITRLSSFDDKPRLLRLLTWVPGKLWAKKNPQTNALRKNLGAASALLCRALQNFEHPAAHRVHQWDNAQALWIKKDLHFIPSKEDRSLIQYFIQLYETQVIPLQSHLRQSIIHNDANNYNVLVSTNPQEHKVTGLIDFGDAIFTHTINDLAIAAAYALMDQPYPLAALAPLVEGFHQELPLTEKEMEVLFPLIAIRLCVSFTSAARNAIEKPENKYLLVSAQPALEVLRKLKDIPPTLAYFSIRHSCGLAPCPTAPLFQHWLAQNNEQLHFVINTKGKKMAVLDLTVDSLELGNNNRFHDLEDFDRTIQKMLSAKNADMGYGGYGEIRPFYTTDAYQVAGNNGPQWRTMHLGIDIWAPATTPVFAPLAAKVHSFQNNIPHRDYGPTIILEHRPTPDLCFYTLYGHLSIRSLEGLEVGQKIEQGQVFATLGAASENGHWPPHLHFQVMLDLLNYSGDFPGVAFPEEEKIWKSVCPNPIALVSAALAMGIR